MNLLVLPSAESGAGAPRLTSRSSVRQNLKKDSIVSFAPSSRAGLVTRLLLVGAVSILGTCSAAPTTVLTAGRGRVIMAGNELHPPFRIVVTDRGMTINGLTP